MPPVACCEPERTPPIFSHELSGGGSMVVVSNTKSLLAKSSSCANPPALADERLSCKDSQKRRRSKYLIASSSDLEAIGGLTEEFSRCRSRYVSTGSLVGRI